MKKDTLTIEKLRGLSGGGWDDVKKLVILPDSVWEDYTKVCLS